MEWTALHGTLLGRAFVRLLGRPERGAMAFVRCLTPDVVAALAADATFAPEGWRVLRVADTEDGTGRTTDADTAVELRETKDDPTLLLVDTGLAGAGMDGIYSAAREVGEAELFTEAGRLAAAEVTSRLSSAHRAYAERAIRRAQGVGRHDSVSPWAEFDFLCRAAAHRRQPGEYLHLLGLWPVAASDDGDAGAELAASRRFVDRLLGVAAAGLTAPARIASLRIAATGAQRRDLEGFLAEAGTRPLRDALQALADQPHLWVGSLPVHPSDDIQAIELTSWRNRNGKIAAWSGLEPPEAPVPELVLKPDPQSAKEYSNLEVRWKARPDDLEKNAVDYRVAILTDQDEELAARDVRHSARQQEKCRFSNDDFSALSEDAFLTARVVVSVVGRDEIERQQSEEFVIRFGKPQDPTTAGGAGRKIRTFSEGLIEFPGRETAAGVAEDPTCVAADAKGFVVLRPRDSRLRKSFRVFRPSLVRDVENEWTSRQGALGRWRVRVRASGERAAAVEFVPAEGGDGPWGRAVAASRRLAERFRAGGGGVSQVHDDRSKSFEVAKEYLLAWTALLDDGDPALAICNTVEVQSLSGRTIGLIVLPAHPLRVAWLAAYDNLLLHAVFDEGQEHKQVQDELRGLDGAMFPAFLPNPAGGVFVFADTLGFHAVGMVPDDDREPKAAVAVLACALGESESTETTPTVGEQSAAVLGDEIVKYVECHESSRLLRMHALRAGDGLTIARALGRVHRHYGGADDDTDNEPAEGPDVQAAAAPAFSLDLYPSPEQRAIAGRFIAEAREKRRSGAGVLATGDRWMLESISLPGGVALPRLRWARKEAGDPKTAAHLAVAFDTFESRVEIDSGAAPTAPFRAFGLLSFFERDFAAAPTPSWRSVVPRSGGGEKHPSERGHTERLDRLSQKVVDAVARHVAEGDSEPTRRAGWRWPWAGSNTTNDVTQGAPVLRTTILPEKADSIRELHRLSDWVVTLDRNAGIEYFDSPRDNREIYDAYVIDCVPEREDLGCLQLITSTSNLEEVHDLLDEALVRMGLSRTRRNAEFLLEHLKSLSGRLAIRLTGNVAPTSELIALAIAHANCRRATDDDACWASLDRGFLVPVDDVRDLLPPLRDDGDNGADGGERQTRPDLIHISTQPRRGLVFRFIEVKHRRHLRQARAPDLLRQVQEQTVALRSRWQEWYGHESVYSAFRAVRRAKLARVLRFYADKAHRHGLSTERYQEVVAELDRMVERGADYAIQPAPDGDRGWVFCPEYAGPEPLEISPAGWGARIFLFGPGRLPDADFRFGANTAAAAAGSTFGAAGLGEEGHEAIPSSRSVSPAVDGVDRDSVGAIPGAGEGGRGADGSESGAAATDPDSSDSSRTRSNGGPSGGTTDPEGATKPSSGQTGPNRSAAPEAPTPVPAVALGADTLTGADVQWSLPIKGNPHLLIAGLPGMGKTTCLLNLCRQMVTAGVHPIVFSYHQDIDERLVDLVDSVRFVDFDGLGFNPLTVTNPESPRAYLDVAGSLRDIFAAIYPELGDLQCESIRRAIKESFSEAGWKGSEAGAREPDFSRFVEILRAEPKPDRGLRTLLARLTELDDYGFFDIGEKRESLWSSDRPTVVRIHTTQNDALQRAFASLVFYGLYKDMFRRGIQERITHALIFDEAHRAAGLKLIPTMAKECRKYGISLVLASQEARDFDASLFSAVANYLVLRLTEADAKALVRNVATAKQERSLIDKIKQMARFRALYFCEGRQRPSSVSLHSLD